MDYGDWIEQDWMGKLGIISTTVMDGRLFDALLRYLVSCFGIS